MCYTKEPGFKGSGTRFECLPLEKAQDLSNLLDDFEGCNVESIERDTVEFVCLLWQGTHAFLSICSKRTVPRAETSARTFAFGLLTAMR